MKPVSCPLAGCAAEGELLCPSVTVHQGSHLPYTLGGRSVLASVKCAPIASPHGPGATSLHSTGARPALGGVGAPGPVCAAQTLRWADAEQPGRAGSGLGLLVQRARH